MRTLLPDKDPKRWDRHIFHWGRLVYGGKGNVIKDASITPCSKCESGCFGCYSGFRRLEEGWHFRQPNIWICNRMKLRGQDPINFREFERACWWNYKNHLQSGWYFDSPNLRLRWIKEKSRAIGPFNLTKAQNHKYFSWKSLPTILERRAYKPWFIGKARAQASVCKMTFLTL